MREGEEWVRVGMREGGVSEGGYEEGEEWVRVYT